MKKIFIIPSLAAICLALFAFQHAALEGGTVEKYLKGPPFSGGGQPGFTGAPFDSNCTECHLGSTQDGTTENTFLLLDADLNSVTEYTPGASYTVSLQMVSNPNKKGFSAVVLDGTSFNAGAFTGDLAIGGTQNFSAGGRNYVSHTSTSNTSAQSS